MNWARRQAFVGAPGGGIDTWHMEVAADQICLQGWGTGLSGYCPGCSNRQRQRQSKNAEMPSHPQWRQQPGGGPAPYRRQRGRGCSGARTDGLGRIGPSGGNPGALPNQESPSERSNGRGRPPLPPEHRHPSVPPARVCSFYPGIEVASPARPYWSKNSHLSSRSKGVLSIRT